MKFLYLILVTILLSSCLAKSSYVDKLSKQVAKNSKVTAKNAMAIHKLDPSKKNLDTVVEGNIAYNESVALSNESSSFDFSGLLETGLSLFSMISGGAGGTAIISSVVGLFLQRKTNKKLKVVARKAADEKDPGKAHKLIDEA